MDIKFKIHMLFLTGGPKKKGGRVLKIKDGNGSLWQLI